MIKEKTRSEINHELWLKGKYVSINKRINNPDKTINEDNLDILLEEMEEDGWVECEIEDVQLRDQIRYIADSEGYDKFVAGGYVRRINETTFSYITAGGMSGVTIANIKQIWKKDGKPKKEKKNKKKNVVKYKKPEEGDFKYEIKINNIVVYRSNVKDNTEKFIKRSKFKRAQEEGFVFY